MSLLEVKHVYKSYQGFRLEDISFELPKGFVMGYIGENGAGKTTTLNLITHLCNLERGEIRIDGICYEDDPKKYLESIGFVGDEAYFPKDMTLKEIQKILKSMYSSFRETEFEKLVYDWQLPYNKKIGDYSKGMKVKLMFATVFCRDTKLLILDEATNGLDLVMRSDVIKMLQEYIMDGEHSILFSTHQLQDLEPIADYITFLHNGKVVCSQIKEELLESYVRIQGEESDLLESQRLLLVGMVSYAYGFEAIIRSKDIDQFGVEFTIEKASIDQIMLHIIKNGGKI
ncbi:MAG: ABC transporter ATP-binding protein [Lachnospiraceae bacterium]|nr:ABC transporter ATP-binding protein [Lachnospiraceae bacterium]